MNLTPNPATERPRRIHPTTGVLVVLGLVLLVADGVTHKHGHFSAENTFGFYPLCGLLSSILVVIAARCLRPILQRPPTYYDGSPRATRT